MIMTEHIYHITTLSAWEKAQELGAYSAPSLDSEGFIHCSKKEQVEGVLQRFYAGQTGLILLNIDPELLNAPLIYEMATDLQEMFPHVYGKIPLKSVVGITSLT